MFDPTCFTRDWIYSFKGQAAHRNIQPEILEKMIYALYLVCLLKVHGLDFVFKGGTSLILLLESENRFSIDVDIICLAEREKLEKLLDIIVKHSSFTKVILDERRSYNDGVPKAHYVFEYESVIDPASHGVILLDILLEKSNYPQHIDLPLRAKWIEPKEEISIITPSIEAITGDKLTAFAPNTIGIPYYKGEDSFSMEICKQLYDIGVLFQRIENTEVVYQS